MLSFFLSLSLLHAEAGPRTAFIPALLAHDELMFDSPTPIDWEALAPRELVSADLAAPGPVLARRIEGARDMFGNANLPYDAPMPRTLEGENWYLLFPDGVAPIRLTGLKGTVRFVLGNQPGEPIQQRSYYGMVIASAADNRKLTEAGVIVRAPSQPTLDGPSSAVDMKAIRELVIDASLGPGSIYRKDLSKVRPIFEASKVYRFHLPDTGERYIFVQWVSDTKCILGCCQHRYSVLAKKPLRLVVRAESGCDV